MWFQQDSYASLLIGHLGLYTQEPHRVPLSLRGLFNDIY